MYTYLVLLSHLIVASVNLFFGEYFRIEALGVRELEEAAQGGVLEAVADKDEEGRDGQVRWGVHVQDLHREVAAKVDGCLGQCTAHAQAVQNEANPSPQMTRTNVHLWMADRW